MKNLLHNDQGTNQYKAKRRIMGLRMRTWKNIIVMLIVMLIVMYMGAYAKSHEAIKIISPCPIGGCKVDASELVYKVPELAPLPEREKNIALIKTIFGKDASTAIIIFTCESGLRTLAQNNNNSDGFPDVGIAQIHVTNQSLFSVADMRSPVANLYRAKAMFDNRGWQPWDSSKRCWGEKI